MDERLIKFWGKAGQEEEEKDPPYHSVLCHVIDVALVAEALLLSPATSPQGFLESLACAEEKKIPWIAFVVALHDVGKISPGFQNKRRDIVERFLPKGGFPFGRHDETDHGLTTFLTLPDILACLGCIAREVAEPLARAVGGHHGSFPICPSIEKDVGEKGWEAMRKELVRVLAEDVFQVARQKFPFTETMLTGSFLMTLAGLTTVADWIGSDESRFFYTGDQTTDLEAYVCERRKIARQAVEELHLHVSPFSSDERKFESLFSYIPDFVSNSCQRTALSVARKLKDPSLIIIETPMGSGKTEAALGIADIWIRERGKRGLYYALPTQATGNQMFKRIKTFLAKHPARTDAQTELHLLHGNADFDDTYQELRATAVFGAEQAAGVTASHWFTAKKRGLIAPFAVGTVDQALLSVLHSRHMFVRLFGLAGKVVVIDEVHAYDTYTSTVLEKLLKWLGALDVSVILLSATLPAERRTRLLKAYSPLLEQTPEQIPPATYPCVIGASKTGHVEQAQVTGLPERRLCLKFLQRNKAQWWETVANHLKADLADGGCAACIVNTVADAQNLYQHLKKSDFPPDTEFILFHSRFPREQRMKIEKRVETLFGKGPDGKPENLNRPHRAIIVATQVIEQSLDVDFDVMVTVIAPIDLVLQRAGRLQRHRRYRPERLAGNPTLYCLSPELSPAQPDFGESSLVYEPAILLKTALTLQGITEICFPNDVEGLIAKVYGPDDVACPEHLCKTLQSWIDLAEGTQQTASYLGKAASIPAPHEEGDECVLRELARVMEDDELLAPAQTRLARPSITFISLHEAGGRLYLDSELTRPVNPDKTPDRSEARDILKQSVTISNPDWVQYFREQPVPSGWARSPLLKYCRKAEFRNGSFAWGGLVMTLDRELGILFDRKK